MASKQSLARCEIIRSRDSFQRAFGSTDVITVNYAQLAAKIIVSDNAELSVAFVVSKRMVNKATHRNRARRLLKEVYRTHNAPLKSVVEKTGKGIEAFWLYRTKQLLSFHEVESAFDGLMNRILERLNDRFNIQPE